MLLLPGENLVRGLRVHKFGCFNLSIGSPFPTFYTRLYLVFRGELALMAEAVLSIDRWVENKTI